VRAAIGQATRICAFVRGPFGAAQSRADDVGPPWEAGLGLPEFKLLPGSWREGRQSGGENGEARGEVSPGCTRQAPSSRSYIFVHELWHSGELDLNLPTSHGGDQKLIAESK
jgi:hypothetical protein